MPKKGKSKGTSILTSSGIGVGVWFVLTILLSLVITSLILSEKLSDQSIGTAAIIITGVSSFAGIFLAIKIGGKGVIPTAALTAGCGLFILVALGVLLYDSGFHNILYQALVVIIMAALACFLDIKTGNRRKTKVRHI